MLDNVDDVLFIGCGEICGGGIALHELVEDGQGDGAACFIQEDDGDEKTEWVVR